VPFDPSNLVFRVEITISTFDLLYLPVLRLLGQSKVALPVVTVPKEFPSTPVEVFNLLEHFDLVVGDGDALLFDNDPHVLVARGEWD